MSSELAVQKHEYRQWLSDLKSRYRQVQLKAAVAVNTALLAVYWDLGADIVARQSNTSWGQGFLTQLSADLMNEFPGVSGFSTRNLEQMRRWATFWSPLPPLAKQPASQLMGIPWWHHVVILTKCREPYEALYYVQQTQVYGWSRSVLTHQIESGLWQREGRAITNFAHTLPAPQSDLARQVLKDPYVFDFLSLTPEHTERELETALIEHVTQFLLELGAGFAYLGRQVPLQVGERDFFIDLLFYHARLHCYVVVELKNTAFKPEYTGQLNYYIAVMDDLVRDKVHDAPTIGLLLCKSKEQTIVEYALQGMSKPIGVSTYRTSPELPNELAGLLPSIESLTEQLDATIIEMPPEEPDLKG